MAARDRAGGKLALGCGARGSEVLCAERHIRVASCDLYLKPPDLAIHRERRGVRQHVRRGEFAEDRCDLAVRGIGAEHRPATRRIGERAQEVVTAHRREAQSNLVWSRGDKTFRADRVHGNVRKPGGLHRALQGSQLRGCAFTRDHGLLSQAGGRVDLHVSRRILRIPTEAHRDVEDGATVIRQACHELPRATQGAQRHLRRQPRFEWLRVVGVDGLSQERAIDGEFLRVWVELREDHGGAIVGAQFVDDAMRDGLADFPVVDHAPHASRECIVHHDRDQPLFFGGRQPAVVGHVDRRFARPLGRRPVHAGRHDFSERDDLLRLAINLDREVAGRQAADGLPGAAVQHRRLDPHERHAGGKPGSLGVLVGGRRRCPRR